MSYNEIYLTGIITMATNKKFDYRLVEVDGKWKAEITRRASSKKMIVSKRKAGFASEAEADEWAKKELESFIENLKARNEREKMQKGEKNKG